MRVLRAIYWLVSMRSAADGLTLSILLICAGAREQAWQGIYHSIFRTFYCWLLCCRPVLPSQHVEPVLPSQHVLEDDAGGGINSGWGKGWGRGMSQKQQRTCSWLIIQCCKSYFGSHGCEQAACVGTGGGDELAVCNDFFESDA